MPDWPTSNASFDNNNAGANIQTHLQAQNKALDKKQAEKDAKYATKEEMKKEIDQLKEEIKRLKELVKFEKVHERSDVDGSTHSMHHTLGLGPNTASPGSHTHDGSNSRRINMVGTSLIGANFTGVDIPPITLLPVPGTAIRLLNGVTISGSRATDTWRQSVMAALVRLGVSNSTSS